MAPMIFRLLSTLVFLVLSLPAPAESRLPVLSTESRSERLTRALLGLGSTDSQLRQRAENELRHLAGPQDFERLAAYARTEGAEVRMRLARSLGGAERHVDLAVRLAAEPEPLQSLGESALAEQLELWSDGLNEALLSGNDLTLLLAEARQKLGSELCRLPLDAPLYQLADRLARLGQVPVSIVVDPLWSPRTPAQRPPQLAGTWDQLLLQLAEVYGGQLVAPVAEGDEGQRFPVFVCLTSRNALVPATAAEWIVDWCKRSRVDADPSPDRFALALAHSSWPAGLEWLGERWTQGPDLVARTAILSRAARGRIAPPLTDPQRVRRLLKEVEWALDPSNSKLAAARAISRALRELPAMGAGGRRLDSVVIENWSELSNPSKRLRLDVLEGMGGAGEDIMELLRNNLASKPGQHPPELLDGYLRAFVGVGGARYGPWTLGDPEGLLTGVANAREAAELAELLIAAEATWPESWGNGLPESIGVPARLCALEWCLGGRFELERCASLMRSLGQVDSSWPEPTSESLQDSEQAAEAGVRGAPDLDDPWALQWVLGEIFERQLRRGNGPEVLQLFNRLYSLGSAPQAKGEPASGTDRLAVLSGVAGQEALARVAARLSGQGIAGDEELAGAMAGGPDGRWALELLGGRLARVLDDFEGSVRKQPNPGQALERGIERALVELMSRGQEVRAGQWMQDLGRRLDIAGDSPFSEHLRRWSWPTAPHYQGLDLVDYDPGVD